jgi:hypothetical protein
MLRSLIYFLVVMFCFLVPARPADASPDPAKEAQALFNQLNPINDSLGPLVDNAIASGNQALAQRLEQLRNIIEEALYNLNNIITDSTIRINADAEGRINQLSAKVTDNLQLLDAIAHGQVTDINADAENRINQIRDATNGLVEALPIPAQPLPNVPSNGFSLIKPTTQSISLFVTGAGLRKAGVSPRAFLLNGDSSDKHLWSHNGIELKVKAASMGLVEIEVPSNIFPSDGQSEKTLVLKLREGNVLPTSVEPSFPLLLCSEIPRYSVQLSLEPIGQFWDKRTVDYPRASGADKRVYITDNGSHSDFTICADEADVTEWKTDPDASNYGLEYAGMKEHIGKTALNSPHKGCIYLYAEKDSSGGGFATAWGLQVHQRRLKKGACSDPVVVPSSSLKYGSNSISTDPQLVLDKCVSTTAGASETPIIRTNLTVTESRTRAKEEVNIKQAIPVRLANGALTVTMDNFGLVKIDLAPRCATQVTLYSAR